MVRTVTTVIEAKNLRYSYPNGALGIHNASIRVERGDILAIIGSNGSGKSTLLMLLGGLLKPSHGRLSFFGEHIVDPRKDLKLRRKIGVMLQSPEDTLFNPTVREDLEFGPAQLDLSKSQIDARIQHVIESVGLPNEKLAVHPSRLSGGEKQKAAIASILTFDPDVLLLDEPFATLDLQSETLVIKRLKESNDLGKTVIIATQKLELTPLVADKVALLGKEKTIEQIGTVRDVLTNSDLLRDNGLAPPPLVQLGKRLNLKDPPLTVDEAVYTFQNLRNSSKKETTPLNS